jgi:GABA permease
MAALAPLGWGAAASAVPVMIFSMMGSEVATIAAVETADPARATLCAPGARSACASCCYLGSMG